MEHLRDEEQVWITSGSRYGAYQEGGECMKDMRKEEQLWSTSGRSSRYGAHKG
jgi:hypothetical protein